MHKMTPVTKRMPTGHWMDDLQREAESKLRFHVIRATDSVPGRKTWREQRARTDRIPFRNEIQIARTVMARAVYTGNREIVEQAADELYDMALEFTKYVSRITQDGRARVAEIETDQAA